MYGMGWVEVRYEWIVLVLSLLRRNLEFYFFDNFDNHDL